jgi:predicted DNA-binding transcriptional regulator AlpA
MRAAKAPPPWRQYFLSYAELADAGVKLSRSQVTRLQGTGEFPKPLARTGSNACTLFFKSEVEAWVEEKRAGTKMVAPADAP